MIFEQYLELGSITALLTELNAKGIRTRVREISSGPVGGVQAVDLEGFEPVSAAKQTSLCKAASPIFGNGFTGPETSLKLKPYLLGY